MSRACAGEGCLETVSGQICWPHQCFGTERTLSMSRSWRFWGRVRSVGETWRSSLIWKAKWSTKKRCVVLVWSLQDKDLLLHQYVCLFWRWRSSLFFGASLYYRLVFVSKKHAHACELNVCDAMRALASAWQEIFCKQTWIFWGNCTCLLCWLAYRFGLLRSMRHWQGLGHKE